MASPRRNRWRQLLGLTTVSVTGGALLLGMQWIIHGKPAAERVAEVKERIEPGLRMQLEAKGFTLGDPIFIRVFKESEELELWARKSGSKKKFSLFKTYPISNYGTGDLGPKLKEGDGQAPTGFYAVSRAQMNPLSKYHLAFNLGFPNAFDKSKARTGSFLMVHGSTVSIGCYAMTDLFIEEIYLLADAALSKGQKAFSVHAFPFRMTDERLAKETKNQWFAEWKDLRKGFKLFENSKVPPKVTVSEGRYAFE